MPPCHLMRPKTNVMVAFLLINIIGMSVHHSHFSACHSLRSVIKTKASSYGTGRIFDRLKNLTRHFVHTEPFNIFALFTLDCRTVIFPRKVSNTTTRKSMFTISVGNFLACSPTLYFLFKVLQRCVQAQGTGW